MQGNIEEELEPNLDKVIDNIQIELVVFVELVVPIIEFRQPIVVALKSSQFVQLVIKPT
jgi:hypothetical protein